MGQKCCCGISKVVDPKDSKRDFGHAVFVYVCVANKPAGDVCELSSDIFQWFGLS